MPPPTLLLVAHAIAAVAARRGSSNIAAALTDVQGFTPVSHTFRGQSVEVHRGILASTLKHAPGTSCRPIATSQQPSCAESIQGAINDLISTHKISTPAQVFITGHSLVSVWWFLVWSLCRVSLLALQCPEGVAPGVLSTRTDT